MAGFWKALFWFALIGLALFGVLRGVAIRIWQVPPGDAELGASITPTLSAGDWIVLWRLTPAGFGDLVLCPDPDDPSNVVIGRIAGEGSDSLRIEGGDLYVNGARMRTESACEDFVVLDPESGEKHPQTCTTEVMGGVRHLRGSTERRDVRTFQVEAGSVFLLSDNRHFPFDSRHYGTVDRETCKETVVFRLLGSGGYWDPKTRWTLIR